MRLLKVPNELSFIIKKLLLIRSYLLILKKFHTICHNFTDIGAFLAKKLIGLIKSCLLNIHSSVMAFRQRIH